MLSDFLRQIAETLARNHTQNSKFRQDMHFASLQSAYHMLHVSHIAHKKDIANTILTMRKEIQNNEKLQYSPLPITQTLTISNLALKLKPKSISPGFP